MPRDPWSEYEASRTRDDEPPPDSGLGEWDAGDDDWRIPPREWLLGNIFCRKFVSSLIADGAVGKSSLRYLQAISCAAGRPLSGEFVFGRSRVLIASFEDDASELRRRIRAIMLHYGLKTEDLKGWLFLAALGRTPWKIARTEAGAHRVDELRSRLIATITRRQIDLVVCDPFVKTHLVGENDNGAVDFVSGIFAALADEHNCAVDLPHHTSKGLADPGNADRGRGASAFKDAARLVYSLAAMSEDEAKIFGIPSAERRSYVRMDGAKVNPVPATSAKWFHIVSVALGNGTAEYPHGDNIGVAEPWTPPDIWGGITDALANATLDEIDAGLDGGKVLFSDHPKAGERSALTIIRKHLPQLNEDQAREILRTWIKNGVLRREPYHDAETRRERQGLRVNATKRPGMRHD